MKNIYLEKLSGKFIRYQHSLCDKLNNCFKNYSARKKKMLLLGFCILFGSLSICIVIDTFYERSVSRSLPALTPVSIPYHIGKNFQQPGVMIDPGTYARVEKFRSFLDSLKQHNVGRYTEIMNTRPHLLDSITAFEKIYITQFKK